VFSQRFLEILGDRLRSNSPFVCRRATKLRNSSKIRYTIDNPRRERDGTIAVLKVELRSSVGAHAHDFAAVFFYEPGTQEFFRAGRAD